MRVEHHQVGHQAAVVVLMRLEVLEQALLAQVLVEVVVLVKHRQLQAPLCLTLAAAAVQFITLELRVLAVLAAVLLV
jgi:hypothetical protein